jgi:hypothetical protein
MGANAIHIASWTTKGALIMWYFLRIIKMPVAIYYELIFLSSYPFIQPIA